MSLPRIILIIIILGFVAGVIYGALGSFLGLPPQEASTAGAVTISVIVAIVLVYVLYTQPKQLP